MSYDVYLNDPKTGKPVTVENHQEGGNQVLGGTEEAWLNVTYNYSKAYALVLPSSSLRNLLDGKTARDVIPVMEEAVQKLGTEEYEKDYWAPTPGNAGYALNILLTWAKQYPDAVFEVH